MEPQDTDTTATPPQPRDISVTVTASPREDFAGYGSNIGRYFKAGDQVDLQVSARELAILKGEAFLMVIEKGAAPAPSPTPPAPPAPPPATPPVDAQPTAPPPDADATPPEPHPTPSSYSRRK